jgi:shikimate dehydrogenase
MEGLQPGLLINATPIGMTGSEDADKMSYTPDEVDAADIIFDVVAMPEQTPLIQYARAKIKSL